MKGLYILIGCIGMIFLVLLLSGCYLLIKYPYLLNPKEMTKAIVLTDKKEYSPGDLLKVKIQNKENQKICFSSCYPYYIQKKSGNWQNYIYEDCDKEDLVESCIEPKSVKSFELTVPVLKKGENRLSILACIGCNVKEKFKGQENFFSNDFTIK